MSKLPLRKEPEIHFMSMPPERWYRGAELAGMFYAKYDTYLLANCAYDVGDGTYYIRATPGGNVTVWWKG